MKKYLIAAAATVLFPVMAQAADPVYVAPPPPGFTWEGLFVGAHVGYAWGNEGDNQSEFFPFPIIPGDEYDLDGVIGGLHAGYNWQRGNFVFGVEGDVDASGLEGDTDFSYDYYNSEFDGIYNYSGTLGFENRWQASLRLRAGVAMDTWLFYGTGGVAFADGKLTEDGYDDAYDQYYSADDSQTHIGYTVGLGIEKAFTPNWIGRLEARYSDFGTESYELYEGYNIDVDFDQVVVNVGLSYKW